MMKRVSVVIFGFGLVFFGALCALSAAEKPEQFPKVSLSEDSEPRYVSVALDYWKGRTAYVLFDGNSNDGYPHAYVWIPGDRRHDPPTKLTANSDGHFGSFEDTAEREDGGCRVAWSFRQQYRERAARTTTHRNYATGKTTKRHRKAVKGYALYFSVDFEYGLPEHMRMRQRLPLSMTISDSLRTATTWDAVGAHGFEPWDDLRMSIGISQQKEPDRCILTFRAGGVSARGHNSRVHSIPEEGSGIVVQAIPYLEPPAYSNSVAMSEIMSPGLSLDLPYGWYRFQVSEFKYGAMVFRMRLHGLDGIVTWPYPLTRD